MYWLSVQGPQGLQGPTGPQVPGNITNTINFQKTLKYRDQLNQDLSYSTTINFKLSAIDNIITLNIDKISLLQIIERLNSTVKFTLYINGNSWTI